jgi:hypothetical protein
MLRLPRTLSFPDPSALTGTWEERLKDTRKIRDEIRTRIEMWWMRCAPWKPKISAPRRRFQFYKRSQLFIGTHNESLPVAAMRARSEHRSPVGING